MAVWYLGGWSFPLIYSAPLDDAWIHFVYARNFGERLSFEYNPGQLENGTTSPLWVILLASGQWVGLDPPLYSKIIGLLLTLATAICLYRFTILITNQRLLGFLTGLTFLIHPYFLYYSLSGMEVPLFSFLLVTSFITLYGNYLIMTGILLGLLSLTRPEGIPFSLVLIVFHSMQPMGQGAIKQSCYSRLTDLLKILVPIIVLYFPALLYSFWLSGLPFPSTYYVKTSTRLLPENMLSLLWNAVIYTLQTPEFLSGVSVIPITIGLLPIGHWRPCWIQLSVLFAPLLYLLVIAKLEVMFPFFHAYSTRYIVYASLFWILGIVLGIHSLGTLSSHFFGGRKVIRHLPVLFLLIVIPNCFMRGVEIRNIFIRNAQEIDSMQVNIAQWINEHYEKKAIGVLDAGAAAYFNTQNQIIDLVGLNNYQLVKRFLKMGKVDGLISLLKDQPIDILVAGENPDIPKSLGWKLREIYRREVAENSVSAMNPMVVYEVQPDSN